MRCAAPRRLRAHDAAELKEQHDNLRARKGTLNAMTRLARQAPSCQRTQPRRMLRVVSAMRNILLLLLLTAPAAAAPFKETVPAKDRDAIVKAVRAALPPINAAATPACQLALDKYNKDPQANLDSAFDAATCYRSAGNVGIAVLLWRTYYTYGSDGAKKRDALRALASGYEAVARFDEAAGYAEKFAAEFAGEQDAAERLIRATCIRRQLGQQKEANADMKQLTTAFKIQVDPDTLCDAVRPIAMPAQKP
jgi:hypothetical protein